MIMKPKFRPILQNFRPTRGRNEKEKFVQSSLCPLRKILIEFSKMHLQKLSHLLDHSKRAKASLFHHIFMKTKPNLKRHIPSFLQILWYKFKPVGVVV